MSQKETKMAKINVGIDLGTTYSAVATFSKEEGKVKLLKNSYGKEFTPSVLWIENGKVSIGEDAKAEQKAGNTSTVAFYKSMMGDDNYRAYIDGKEYSAMELSTMYLRELKAEIERENGVQIGGAVITVPAYFNEKQRNQTRLAGEKAGFKVFMLLNEPTSAIIAYGLTGGGKKNVLVYDLGGGTFDVTVAEVNGTAINVLATNGNHQLGGKDWDQALLDEIVDRFRYEHGVDIKYYPNELSELQVKCEDAKKKLSSLSSTTISIVCDGVTGRFDVTREEFDEKTSGLLNETYLLINDTFNEIGAARGTSFGWKDIDEVVLVGGSTRMPQVRDMIVAEYGRAPITKDINVDTIVASGAAMQAELCVSSTICLTVVDKKATQATGKTQVATLTISNADIKDITAHSLGMLAMAADEKSYVNSIIIPKNSNVNVPFAKDFVFGGKKLDVYVLQGESRDPHQTAIIGRYEITGMKGDKKENITVTFLYNSDGVVEVTARIKGGAELRVERKDVAEDMTDIINRLKKEADEAKNARKVEITVIIDVSGSMSGDRIEKARQAARGFVDDVLKIPGATISLIGFADSEQYACKKSRDKQALYDAIAGIWNLPVGGGTSGKPIAYCYRDYDRDAAKVMIVLTDGYWGNQSSEISASDAAKAEGIIIYGIGIGEADQTFLDRISSGKGKKVDLSNLGGAFREVASSIATETGNGSLI